MRGDYIPVGMVADSWAAGEPRSLRPNHATKTPPHIRTARNRRRTTAAAASRRRNRRRN